MIQEVIIRARAKKQLLKVPIYVSSKLKAWVQLVESRGVERAREIPGYHDEGLKGARQGQRSIRLSRGYRAIYVILKYEERQIVSIEEVSKHVY